MPIKRAPAALVAGLLLLLLLLLWVWHRQLLKEGFVWSSTQIADFLEYENTVYPNTQFNLQVLQDQASPGEVDTLLSTGLWPWQQDTQDRFLEAVGRSTLWQIQPEESMVYARRLYNDEAMRRKLFFNTTEGKQAIRYCGSDRAPAARDGCDPCAVLEGRTSACFFSKIR